MIKVSFFLHDKNQERTPLKCSVTIRQNRVRFGIGKSVNTADWDSKKQRLVERQGNYSNLDINNELDELTHQLKKVYTVLSYEQETVTPEEVRDEYLGKNKRNVAFWDYTNEFVASLQTKINKKTGKKINQNTINKFNQLVRRLSEFEARSKTKIQWTTFTVRWLNSFENYLHDQDLKQNTVHKHYKALKQILSEASAEGVNKNEKWRLRDFSVAQEKVQNFSLLESEVEKLHQIDLSANPKLDRVRDQFLLECWTGVRFSDLDKLNDIDLSQDTLKVTTQKTQTEVHIPITDPVRSVVRKYHDKGESLPSTISNQRFNDYLKDLGKVAGLTRKFKKTYTKGGKRVDEVHEIWEVLTSHVGRRTFATNMYNKGIPKLYIMKITGHRTEEEFMKYINIDAEMSAKMIAKRLQSDQ